MGSYLGRRWWTEAQRKWNIIVSEGVVVDGTARGSVDQLESVKPDLDVVKLREDLVSRVINLCGVKRCGSYLVDNINPPKSKWCRSDDYLRCEQP